MKLKKYLFIILLFTSVSQSTFPISWPAWPSMPAISNPFASCTTRLAQATAPVTKAFSGLAQGIGHYGTQIANRFDKGISVINAIGKRLKSVQVLTSFALSSAISTLIYKQLFDISELHITSADYAGCPKKINTLIGQVRAGTMPKKPLLLTGSPGSGKTQLVKYIASKLRYCRGKTTVFPLFEVKPASLVTMIPQLATIQLDCFLAKAQLAADKHPLKTSIVFIDEFHSFTENKSLKEYFKTLTDGVNSSKRFDQTNIQTLAYKLAGGLLNQKKEGTVIIIAATDRPDADLALDRRFEKINVEKDISEDEYKERLEYAFQYGKMIYKCSNEPEYAEQWFEKMPSFYKKCKCYNIKISTPGGDLYHYQYCYKTNDNQLKQYTIADLHEAFKKILANKIYPSYTSLSAYLNNNQEPQNISIDGLKIKITMTINSNDIAETLEEISKSNKSDFKEVILQELQFPGLGNTMSLKEYLMHEQIIQKNPKEEKDYKVELLEKASLLNTIKSHCATITKTLINQYFINLDKTEQSILSETFYSLISTSCQETNEKEYKVPFTAYESALSEFAEKLNANIETEITELTDLINQGINKSNIKLFSEMDIPSLENIKGQYTNWLDQIKKQNQFQINP
ncbi:MAG: ATP-binding protein [Candidatus Babeliales bacterium]